MVSYCNDNWIAFLCEHIIRKSHQRCKDDCPACLNKLNSPLLHKHLQLSLLEQLRIYFTEMRGLILQDLDRLYNQFSYKLPHSDDKKRDKVIYINIARNFLLTASCDSIYFGRYIDEHNDSFINEEFKIKK